MISKFVKEQKRYTLEQLSEIFEIKQDEELEKYIQKLKEYGILKVVNKTDEQKNMTDLENNDIDFVDINIDKFDCYYVFVYVGIIIIGKIVLKCYPKYLKNDNPFEELKQVIKVIEKCNAKEQIIKMYNGNDDNKNYNLLAIQMFLINDYYENGVYINSNEIIETNGSGDILWDRTISQTFALINNNKPYYIELQNKKNVENENDYFRRLHKCILTKVSSDLEKSNLLEIFEITEIDLSDENLESFGDNEYIIYRIEKELNAQFNTRKQLLLKAMYAYIFSQCYDIDSTELSLFGTNNFNLVWEKICSEVFNNQLYTQIKNLNLPNNSIKYNPNLKLIDLIEKPYWSVPNMFSNKTLIPDIVTITKEDMYKFTIIDAKYYNSILEDDGMLRGVPGIESITKQYLYQLVYRDFIKEYNINKTINCFVMPCDGNDILNKGFVSLNMLDKIGLDNIQIRMIPARIIFDKFLKNEKFDNFKSLKLDSNIKKLPVIYGDNYIENEILKLAENVSCCDFFQSNIGKFKTPNGRNIYYYGEEFGDIILNKNEEYYGIKNLNDMFQFLLINWNEETILPQLRNFYNKNEEPTLGQSRITSLLVNNIFGGTIHRIRINNNFYHYFNIINNNYIDLTRDQFGSSLELKYEINESIDGDELLYDNELLYQYNNLLNKMKIC